MAAVDTQQQRTVATLAARSNVASAKTAEDDDEVESIPMTEAERATLSPAVGHPFPMARQISMTQRHDTQQKKAHKKVAFSKHT